MLTRIHKTLVMGLICAAGALTCGFGLAARPARGAGSDVYPPWQRGANNDVAADSRGLAFTEPDADNLADFHGDPVHPCLSLFVGGNYFFAMAPLVKAFERRYPTYAGHVYWETIPPGLLVKQMMGGGTITVGNMTWTVQPDVYLAGMGAVKKQVDAGLLQGPPVPYVTNSLTIMVAKGDPAHIRSLADLARPDLRVALPNPEFEGIARQVKDAFKRTGGDALLKATYETKVADGSATLTHIHHRQTPLWIMQGKAQAGVTWQSEAVFQEQAGNAISHVDIAPEDNATEIYAGAVVKNAPHPDAAQKWLDFIRSPEALQIFKQYGFKAYIPNGLRTAS